MNILFLTLSRIASVESKGIYTDLMRNFRDEGHHVCIVTPHERRFGKKTELVDCEGVKILGVKTLNIQKTNVVEKGVGTLLIESQYKSAIKKYLGDVKFDLVLYSTPPITLVSAIEYVKNRDGAKTYLLLKDIFPQNAVDIGMMSKSGLKGLLYNHFRRVEKKLYKVSDFIGCMSQANVDYVLKHNPEIDPKKVEVCPNSIDVVDKSVDDSTRRQIREKYSIPLDKKVFVYGGNLGKPQGIPFIIECLKRCEKIENIFFLIVGDGTEYSKIENYLSESKHENMRLMKRLPKEDYDTLVGACDVGLIFLDHRFTIPNFPSRLLSYMQAKIPVLACTDPNTDIGKVITEGGFGWWCESNDADGFGNIVSRILQEDTKKMGENGFEYLKAHYSVEQSYETIMKHFEER